VFGISIDLVSAPWSPSELTHPVFFDDQDLLPDVVVLVAQQSVYSFDFLVDLVQSVVQVDHYLPHVLHRGLPAFGLVAHDLMHVWVRCLGILGHLLVSSLAGLTWLSLGLCRSVLNAWYCHSLELLSIAVVA
jgi:hypothetical protein